MRRRAQTEGCIAGWRRKYPARSGRALPPCFAGYVATRRVRRPGRIFAGSGAAPLRRLRRHLPLQGRLLGWRSPERLPCKGSWMRRKAQTEGCIAGLRWKYPAGSGRALPRSARRFRKAPAAGEIARPYIAAENGRQPVSGSRLQRPGNGGRVAAGECGGPEGYLQGQVRHPLRRLRRHLPLAGEASGAAAHRKVSLSGGGFQAAVCSKPASPGKGEALAPAPLPFHRHVGQADLAGKPGVAVQDAGGRPAAGGAVDAPVVPQGVLAVGALVAPTPAHGRRNRSPGRDRGSGTRPPYPAPSARRAAPRCGRRCSGPPPTGRPARCSNHAVAFGVHQLGKAAAQRRQPAAQPGRLAVLQVFGVQGAAVLPVAGNTACPPAAAAGLPW